MPVTIVNDVVFYAGLLTSLLMLAAGGVFVLEKESRAAMRAFLLSVVFILLSAMIFYAGEGVVYLTIPLLFSGAALMFYLFIPGVFFSKEKPVEPSGRIDERNTMFSRNELLPGTERFEKYYKEFPEHEAKDDIFRSNPGLLGKKAAFYNPFAFAMSDAGFETVAAFHPLVKGKPSDDVVPVNEEKLDAFVRAWLKKRGVVSVGVTEMKDYHRYSIGGRGDRYGKKYLPKKESGIVFTVEMDGEMVACSPNAPIVMESAQQYLNAGTIATQLSVFLRNLGFEARAHIDGNYEVVCPLVARDAGLGEIGRMGLLMTPELGPRVRIAVVTTNAPLKVDDRNYDPSVEDFCGKCLKCADACPASAISKKDKEVIGGVKRWQIDQEKCFTYWSYAGTDCGRCIGVCPYSHPDNLFHNTIRFMIRHFPNFRKSAVMLDDFFYGRRPKPHKMPEWMDI